MYCSFQGSQDVHSVGEAELKEDGQQEDVEGGQVQVLLGTPELGQLAVWAARGETSSWVRIDKVGQSVRQGHGDPSPVESLGHCTGTEESSRVKALERLRKEGLEEPVWSPERRRLRFITPRT